MNSYKLLTPGPLTTTDTVKQVMLFDHCTWDDDYKQITQTIRRTLLALGHVSEPEYTAVLMQGSGTFGVESVLTSVIGREDKLLIAANGAYGLRMAEICRHAGIAYTLYEQDNHKRPQADVGQSTWQRTWPSPTCPWSMGRPPAASSTMWRLWAGW